jgi:hypothetical protein
MDYMNENTLGRKVLSGASMFLLYISAQISYPPSIHKFLVPGSNLGHRISRVHVDVPEGSHCLNHDLLLIIREAGDQCTNNIFPLKQSSGRRIVVNQI